MNFTLKNQQIKRFYKLIILRESFNSKLSHNTFFYISFSKVCHLRKQFNEKLKIANEFVSQETKKYEDTFGNIENYEIKYERIKDDPEDIKEYERSRAALNKTVKQYINEIKTHLEKLEYDKAINILEVDMVNDSKPTIPFIYRLLLSYNAKIGNVEEAYRLYLRYKKRNGKDNGAIITSMFNACANSKNSFIALEKANAVRKSLNKNETYAINIPNYHAMLKAFGRHGDLQTSLKIVDEVLEKKDKVKRETFCFLLQACISDTNSGLRHAIMVWRTMLQNKLKPTIFEFNLMLRCVRDCFLGEPELLKDFAQQIQDKSSIFYKRKVLIKTVDNKKERKVLKIPITKEELWNSDPSKKNQENVEELVPGKRENRTNILDLKESEAVHEDSFDSSELKDSKNEIIIKETPKAFDNFNAEVPNLLALEPSLGSVISFNNFTKPYEKLLLLGGIEGFLELMSEFEVKPNIKTFTLLLDIIPSTTEDEEKLMEIMKSHKVKPDTGFFNVLIKNRCIRENNILTQDSLLLMQKEEVTPDIITFGVMAMGCNTMEKGIELINSAHNFGYRLNTEILENLLHRALRIPDWNYVKTILAVAKKDEVQLSTKFIALLKRGINHENYKFLKKKNEQVVLK